MQNPPFIIEHKSAILADINSHTYFFTVNHITKESGNRHIYGIRLNTNNYFLSKVSGMPGCEQLDSNPPLTLEVLEEFCEVMTQIELKYKKRPSLEYINKEIFRIIAQIRSSLFRKRAS